MSQAGAAPVPNSAPITIGDCCDPQIAPAAAVTVSGLGAATTEVTATLTVAHVDLADVDLLLVSPAGQKVVLLSDTGLSASGETVTFDDAASGQVPAASPLQSGTYTPTNRAEDCTGMPAVDSFPGAPAGATTGTLSSFDGTNPNGTWYLYAVDDCEVDSGSLPAGITLDIATGGSPTAFSNGGTVVLADCCPATAAGTYPSAIAVSGQSGQVQGISVTLEGLTHGYAADLNAILEGPGGQAVLLMSDAGRAASAADLTFNDAGSALPVAAPLTSGIYSPTNLAEECAAGGGTDPFPGSAPASPGTSLSAFNGTDPNGTWKLWLADDCGRDAGQLTGGWTLDLATGPTAVRLLSFSASRGASGVTLRWRTAQEAKLLGFNVYRTRGRKLLRLNRTLVAAVGRVTGAAYSFRDPLRTDSAGRYRLQAVGVDGKRSWLASARPITSRLAQLPPASELQSLCALEKNGSLRRVTAPTECRKKEGALTVAPGPTYTCVQADGSIRRVASAACPGAGTYLALPPQNADAHFCADADGRLRKVNGSGDCTGGETPHVSTASNHAPTDIGLSSSSISENAGPNAVVGTLSTTDAGAGSHTYTLVAGQGATDNGAFNVNGTQLRATSSLDFEQQSSYSIRVRSTDGGGLFFEEEFTIGVDDVTGTSATTITSDGPDPSKMGEQVTVAVQVASVPSGGTTPTGSVLVDAGFGSTCTAALVSGAGSCQLTPVDAPTSTLTGTYSGDVEYEPSSDGEDHGIALVFGPTSVTTLQGGSGGTSYVDACPPGRAIVGYSGWVADEGWLRAVAATCGVVTVRRQGGVYVVTTTTDLTLPLRGSASGTQWTRSCSPNQLVVGFEGRSGLLVDQLTLRCAPVLVNASTYAVSTGTETALAPVGGSGGTAFATIRCPSGSVAWQSRVRAASSVDAFGLGCVQLS